MAEYIDRDKVLEYRETGRTDDYSGNETLDVVLTEEILGLTPANVVEREKIDKAIEEIRGYARFHRDKIHNDVEQGKYLAYEKCLEILKRNIGE